MVFEWVCWGVKWLACVQANVASRVVLQGAMVHSYYPDQSRSTRSVVWFGMHQLNEISFHQERLITENTHGLVQEI